MLRFGSFCFCVLAVASMAACQQSEPQHAPSSGPDSHQVTARQTAILAREEGKEAAGAETSEPEPAPVTAKQQKAMENVSKQASRATNSVAKQPQITFKPATPATLAHIAKPEPADMPDNLPTVSGNPVKGAKIARGKCGACHYFDKERKKVGPSLKGVYGRGPTIDGVPFAKWDAQALDAWLASPKAVKPKTKMSFKGLAKKQDRDDVIAYLKTI